MTQVPEPVEVIVADGGVVSCTDVQRLLRLAGVHVRKVRFAAREPQRLCQVPWTGVDVRDQTVHGTLDLHLDAGARYLLVEGKIDVQTPAVARCRSRPGASDEPRGLYPREVQVLELLARDGLRQAAEQPATAAAVVPFLVRIVDLLVGGSADDVR